MVEMLEPQLIEPGWSAPSAVCAFSTTRIGGCSTGPYSGFNLATHVGDNTERVETNRRWLARHLKLPSDPQWLAQNHGSEVLYKDSAEVLWPTPVADALWTDQPNVVLSIMTADCLPVLIASRCGQVVAAIHGGWRGLASGILQKSVASLPLPARELIAWLGPAIGQQHFEVGNEVRKIFVDQDDDFTLCFMSSTTDANKCYADIFSIAQVCLKQSGVTTVVSSNLCTVSDERLFFSHRRDRGKSGRMATLIWRQ